jgi:hypothetical protein
MKKSTARPEYPEPEHFPTGGLLVAADSRLPAVTIPYGRT